MFPRVGPGGKRSPSYRGFRRVGGSQRLKEPFLLNFSDVGEIAHPLLHQVGIGAVKTEHNDGRDTVFLGGCRGALAPSDEED